MNLSSADRVLHAAVTCFARGDVRRTTMNAIAEEAGLGVATVYRRFPTKAALVRAAVLREAAALIAEVVEALPAAATIEDRAAAGFAAFARGLARRPLLRQVVRGDQEVAAFLGGEDGPAAIIALATDAIAGLLNEAQAAGEIPPLDARLVGEVYARLALSLVLSPAGAIPLDDGPEDFARTYLVRLLRPDPGSRSDSSALP